MKRILYFAVVILTSLAFTACGDDDDVNAPTNPQNDVAGTYSGEWTIYVEETDEFADGSPTIKKTIFSGTDNGSVILTAASQYVLEIRFISEKVNEYLGENLKSNKINVTKTSNGYFIYNPKKFVSKEDETTIADESYGATISEDNKLIIGKFVHSEQKIEEVQTGTDRRGRPIMKASTVTTTSTVTFSGTKQ